MPTDFVRTENLKLELDGNVADFSPDELIRLAEGITRP